MSNELASLIALLTPSIISDGFLIVISFLFLFSSVSSFSGINYGLTGITPNLLTSLGILGTFTGIVSGLMGFDPQNITESIPSLLDGLKTAFLTSLFGMFFSILFKGVESITARRVDSIKSKHANADDIYQVMALQLETSNTQKDLILALLQSFERIDEIADNMQKQVEINQDLVKAVQGEEDASIVSQIRNMRTDINDVNRKLTQHSENQQQRSIDFQNQLWNELKHFGDLLSKSATEQVINALKDVISDFNNKLTEQFGDNFKRLDDSVKKLVDWQDNYRIQLEDMQKKYQLGVDSISVTEKSVVHISEKAEIIPATMMKLHDVMTHGQQQLIDLEDRLKAFEELRDKAIDAMPQIQLHLENTIQEIEDSVKYASTHYTQMLDQSNKVIDKYSKATIDGAENIRNQLMTGANELGLQLKSSADNIGGKLVEASQVFESNADLAATNMKGMNNELTSAAEQIHEELKESIMDLKGDMNNLVASIKDEAKQMSSLLKDANTDLILDTKTMRDETTKTIQDLQLRLEGALTEVFRRQTEEVDRTFKSIEKHMIKTLNESGESINTQFSVFDKEMEQEVSRIIKLMGSNLTTVTHKFTQDYTQLTNEMSKVVRSSQGAF
ncbi:hypothetical protein A9D46_09560 [Photobacterium damselae subsp. damselae]|uniref:hypothetical protein n=1 Tax=Photobacterium damselae TaxID=38293 RepID=UPI00084A6AA0|nr:hypothetical protein [Photobacterium damselae]OEC83724.1 hypothetical protein A9D46_09560 [Photobacterium damselae subsp. damselae]